MRKAWKRVRVQLSGHDELAGREGAGLCPCRRLVKNRYDFARPVRERSHHGGGCEKDIEHHDYLAGNANAVQLFLLGEHVDLVVELDAGAHCTAYCAGATRS